ICSNITGRAFCALGDSIEPSIKSSIKFFRDEYLEHQRQGGCPFDPAASTLIGFGGGSGGSSPRDGDTVMETA
ncbi:MAG: NADH-ubiquinone oxidoreductase-F iron-sulfur binding region domain-containing protein, partial [Streptosporangiaceae bacterium]